MFYTVKLKSGENTHQFAVDAVSYTDAEKMSHEIGGVIVPGSSFEVGTIQKVNVVEFVEDDSSTKDIKVFKGKYASREELPNGKVKTKKFLAFVEGENIKDALTNLEIYLKGFMMDTVIIGIEETELTEVYTADDIRSMKSLAAA